MRILKSGPHSAKLTASELLSEHIVILPTDTIYGFSGIIDKTADAIARIKGREADKQFIALIADPSDIYRYTGAGVPQQLIELWPAPLTLIVPLKGGTGTHAFRCPADEWLRSVIRLTGSALYSTSVNYAGTPAMTDINTICTEFEESVALVVDDGELKGSPSTIIDCCTHKPKILRQGTVFIAGYEKKNVPKTS